MFQLTVFIMMMILDVYLARKISKKYNVKQLPMIKNNGTSPRHKKVLSALSLAWIPILLAIYQNFDSNNFNELIALGAYGCTAFAFLFSVFDLYYQKGKNSFIYSLKRTLMTFSFAISVFLILIFVY